MFRYIFIFFLAFVLVSCQTVTISPQGKSVKYSSSPSYSRTQHFFLFGLVGQSFINVKSVCGDRVVKQMQTQQKFLDGFLGKITFGIYTPRTASIWCGESVTEEGEI